MMSSVSEVGQPLHKGETDETDEHGARPDDALQDRRHVGETALRLEIVAEIAGAHEHVRRMIVQPIAQENG